MHSKRYSVTSTSSSSGSLRQTKNSDIVKRGCLYVKRPPSNNPLKLRFKTWQKRYLVLRDTWTADGDTLLELYSSEAAAALNSADDTNRPSSGDSLSLLPRQRLPSLRSHSADYYSINLRNVIFVDVYTASLSFPYAFIVLRSGKSPLIFGAKTDLEMREWMMAVKLLADKVARLRPLQQPSPDGSSGGVNGAGISGRRTSDVRPPPPPVEARSTLRRDVVHRSTPHLLDNGGFATLPNGRSNKISSPIDSSIEQSPPDLNSKFLVRVQKTDDSSLHQLEGEFYIVASDTEITLRKSPESEASISWPMQHIRKLKSESMNDSQGDLITLVASSKCGQSQGTYTFRISSGVNLIRQVRLYSKRGGTIDSCCRRQQRDIAKLKNAATSSSLERLLTSSLQESRNFGHSMQSLIVTSSESSSESQLDQPDDIDTNTLSTRQSQASILNANSYLPIIDDSGNALPPRPVLVNKKRAALSRSTGSLGLPSGSSTTTIRQDNEGFQSCEETTSMSPPVPPPRPVHTLVQ